jgi:hypothetical protein
VEIHLKKELGSINSFKILLILLLAQAANKTGPSLDVRYFSSYLSKMESALSTIRFPVAINRGCFTL